MFDLSVYMTAGEQDPSTLELAVRIWGGAGCCMILAGMQQSTALLAERLYSVNWGSLPAMLKPGVLPILALQAAMISDVASELDKGRQNSNSEIKGICEFHDQGSYFSLQIKKEGNILSPVTERPYGAWQQAKVYNTSDSPPRLLVFVWSILELHIGQRSGSGGYLELNDGWSQEGEQAAQE